MTGIQKYVHRLRLLFQCLFYAIPMYVLYFWATVNTPWNVISEIGLFDMSIHLGLLTQTPVPYSTRILAAVANLLMAGIAMYALRILIQLFKRYEQGEIFSTFNARCYQKLGISVFFWVFGGVIYGSAMSIILSFNNPPGERVLSITFVGMDFLSLVLGFMVLVISQVMKEGHKIADENMHTI